MLGITQDPNTMDYVMVLFYCKNGNLRNSLNKDYKSKIWDLSDIARGLLDIHNAGIVHRDLHSGNTLYKTFVYINDLRMCQPTNDEERLAAKKGGVYRVLLPYMAQKLYKKFNIQKRQIFIYLE